MTGPADYADTEWKELPGGRLPLPSDLNAADPGVRATFIDRAVAEKREVPGPSTYAHPQPQHEN